MAMKEETARPRGVRKSTMTDSQVERMRDLRKNGVSIPAIATRFGLSYQAAWRLVSKVSTQ